MVKIRLSKTGRKNRPSYRIVAIDSKAKRDGKYLEKLGHYNPSENLTKVKFDKKRYEYWTKIGAQPTKTVAKLIKGTYKYKKYSEQKKLKKESESEKQAQEDNDSKNIDKK